MKRSLDEVLDSPSAAGTRLIARDFLDEWLDTLPRLHAQDSDEALHDYRVALRKLRSWLRTFDEGGGKVQRRLSALNEATGEARDAEVMETWLEGDGSPAAAFALEQLKRGLARIDLVRLDARTQAAAERLIDKLSHYSLTMPLAGDTAVTPFSWTYAAALRRLHHELVEEALSVGSVEDPKRLHKVRIRAKRLRYALVPLKPWVEAVEAQKLLKERQDVLGELHDRHAFVEVLESALTGRPSPELAVGLDALLQKARGEAHALLDRYTQHRHQNDVRLATLLDVLCERLGRRLGLQLEVVPQT